jgi:hypothetical protein
MKKHLIWSRTLGAAVIVAALSTVSPSQAQQGAPQAEPPSGMGVDQALQALQQEPGNVEVVDYLGALYAATGDQRIVEELLRLVREADDPEVREAAALSLQVEPMSPDEAAAPGKPVGAPAAGPEAPLFDVPADVDAVRVECQGSCNDNTLGQICALTDSPTPIAVSCDNARDAIGTDHVACGGASNNRCDMEPSIPLGFNTSTSRGTLCHDTGGWDAIVYCARP